MGVEARRTCVCGAWPAERCPECGAVVAEEVNSLEEDLEARLASALARTRGHLASLQAQLSAPQLEQAVGRLQMVDPMG